MVDPLARKWSCGKNLLSKPGIQTQTHLKSFKQEVPEFELPWEHTDSFWLCGSVVSCKSTGKS